MKMFRMSYQRGIFTILSSVGSKPLEIWEKHVKDGYVTRFLDQELKSLVVELGGNNVSTTYISCPKGKTVLGISMPFLVMIVKNLHKYFAFEVTILDDTGAKRRFRVGNFQSTTTVSTTCTVMPICLQPGWNQINFNLADFTLRAYNRNYVEVQTIKVNANIRLKRIYFTDKIYLDEELPNEFKLFFPAAGSKDRERKKVGQEKENVAPPVVEPEHAVVHQLETELKTDFPDFRRRSSSRTFAKKEVKQANYKDEATSETFTIVKPMSRESIRSATPRQFKAQSKASEDLSLSENTFTKTPKQTRMHKYGEGSKQSTGAMKSTTDSQQEYLEIQAPIGSPKGKYNILVDALNVKNSRPIL